MVAGILAGCTTDRSSSVAHVPPQTLDLAQLDPGAILIAARPEPADIHFDPPANRLESAGEGAAEATRKVLNTPQVGHGQIDTCISVLGFAFTPFAAAYGAVSASRQRLSPEKVGEAERELAEAMRAAASSELLRERLLAAAQRKTRRRLTSTNSTSGPVLNPIPTSARLEVAIEALHLKTVKAHRTEFVLHIQAHAWLVQVSDGRLLLEHAYHYESGPAFFIDWARVGGLAPVAKTGYESIAEQIAEDVFHTASAPPILLGPGRQRSQSSSIYRPVGASRNSQPRYRCFRHEWRLPSASQPTVVSWRKPGSRVRCAARPAGVHPRASRVAGEAVLEVASLGPEVSAAIEVHSGSTNQPLRLRSPVSGSKDTAPNPDAFQAEWALDGLQEDRNAVVQFFGCIGALPLGLYEQTIGLVGRRSRERTAKLVAELNGLANQSHFEGELADEVAQSLRSQAGLSVIRTQGLPGTPSPVSESSAEPTPPPAQPPRTSLDIQVVAMSLVAKHRHSRSRALSVEILATVVRAADGQELYCIPIHFQSQSKKLTDWAGSDAKLLREELQSCSHEATQALTTELLKRGLIEP